MKLKHCGRGRNRILVALSLPLLLATNACGVKGRPLPPLEPAPIGQGEPLSKSKKSNLPSQENKYNYQLEEEAQD